MMVRLRSVVVALTGFSALGCSTVTECDCAVPFGVIFGTVSGATTRTLIEARVGPGPCRDDYFPTTVVEQRLTETNGSYEVQFPLPSPGSMCVVVTAETAELPLLKATQRVEAVLVRATLADPPQRIRVDVTLPPR
jgi:hypothetical protein